MTRAKWSLALVGAMTGGLLTAALSGCTTAVRVGQAAGVVNETQADALIRTGQSVGRAMESITPEQEYYLGRAVGAMIVHQYKVYDNEAATRYVNLVGQALALASDKPETFGGYAYLILDSDEINAFAAPGGLIFLSRGMLRLCQDEDDLAAVLAHEVAHVNLGHAVGAIKNSRWTDVVTILGTETARQYGGQQLAQLTSAFEGSIQDVTGKLVTSGYARGQEREADALAVKIMRRLGYDPTSLPRVLGRMDQHLKPGGLDFAKTHPPPQSRIADLARLGVSGPPSPAQVRQERFARAMRGI